MLFFLNFIYFNQRLVTLQYCGGFCHTWTWISHGCTYVPPPWTPNPLPSPPHPSVLSQSTDFECTASCIELALVTYFQFSSVALLYNSLQPHGLHARVTCPSPTPRAYSNSCPSSRWCHSTISSSVIPFSCLQSFPASGSFPMSQFFSSGGQSIGVWASSSVLPMNIQDWSPLGWTGWISLQSNRLSRVFSNTTVQKHQFLGAQFSLLSKSHIHTWLLEKP